MRQKSSVTREIRVFISSTFSDMSEERKHLNTKVFPELRSICQQRDAIFTEVDLQWGIDEKQTRQGGAVEICLEEINRCHPYFIGLLGERYGWSPHDDGLAVREDEKEYSEEDQKKLISINNEGFKENVRTWVEQGESVTAMEIMHGVLDSEKQTEFSYFYFRDKNFTKELLAKAQTDAKENAEGEVKETVFLEPDGSNKHKKLTKLKEHILTEDAAWHVCKEFNADGGIKYFDGYVNIEQLGNQIRIDLLKSINERFPENKKISSLDKERKFHAIFANSRLQFYIPDEDTKDHKSIFTKMFGHFESSDSPLVISGKMGSGKSALLANFARRWIDKNPDGLVIEHYADSGGESDAVGVLRRVMNEIKHEYNIKSEVPTKANDVYQKFGSWLLNVTIDKPLLLLLDGVNQFIGQKDEMKRFVASLPAHTGQHVKIILSTLEGEVLDAAQERDWSVEKVEPLTKLQRSKLVVTYLQQYTKSLASDLTDTLIGSGMGDNPLYLRVVLDELRVDANHDKLKAMLDGYCEASDLVELFKMVLDRCEEAYKNSRVSHIMGLIWASRYGMSEHELRAICHEKSCNYVAPLYISRLLFGLSSYLANREGLYGFMHDAFRLAVEKKYIIPDIEKETRSQIADYFSKEKVSQRQIDELPWHWVRLSESQHIQDYLARLKVVYSFSERILWQSEMLFYWNIANCDPASMLERYQDQHNKAMTSGELPVIEIEGGPTASQIKTWNEDRTMFRRNSGNSDYDLVREFYLFSGFYVEAEALARENQEVCLIDDSPQMAAALHERGVILQEAGDYKEAEEVYRQSLEINRQARVLNSLGSLLFLQGKYAESEGILREVLEIAQEREDDHLKVMCMHNLAITFEGQNELALSEALLRQAWDIRRGLFGQKSKDASASLHSLGLVLFKQGKASDAEELLRQTLEIRCDLLGTKHPIIAQNLNSLARALVEQKKYVEAEQLFRESLNIRRERFENTHPHVADSLNNLVSVLKLQGKDEEAERFHRELLEMKSEMLGDNHTDVADSLNNQDDVCHSQGKDEEAEQFHREQIFNMAAKLLRDAALFFRNVGEENNNLKTQMNNNATMYEQVGNLLEENPLAEVDLEEEITTHAHLAARLLRHAAQSFRNSGKNNINITEQMNDNATAYEQVANLIENLLAGFDLEKGV